MAHVLTTLSIRRMLYKFYASVARFLRLEWAFIKNCLTRDIQYRGNFFLVFVMDIVWYTVNLGFFEVIYFNTSTIAGYTRSDVFFFMATTFVIDAIDMTFFASGIWQMSDFIRKGDFDFILSKPISPLMYSTMRYVSFGSLLDLIFAVGLLIIAFFNLDVTPTALDIAAYIVLAVSGLIVMYSIQVFFAALGFIFVNASTGLQWGFHHLYQLAMRPEAIYKGIFRFFLLYLLPMIVISSVPSTMILRGFNLQTFLTCITISMVSLFLTVKFFYFALRHYESASS